MPPKRTAAEDQRVPTKDNARAVTASVKPIDPPAALSMSRRTPKRAPVALPIGATHAQLRATIAEWEAVMAEAREQRNVNALVGAVERRARAARALERLEADGANPDEPELDRLRRHRSWAVEDGAWPTVAMMDREIGALVAAEVEAKRAAEEADRRSGDKVERLIEAMLRLPVGARARLRMALADGDPSGATLEH